MSKEIAKDILRKHYPGPPHDMDDDLIIAAMQEYHTLQAKPLVDYLTDIRSQCENDSPLARGIDTALSSLSIEGEDKKEVTGE